MRLQSDYVLAKALINFSLLFSSLQHPKAIKNIIIG